MPHRVNWRICAPVRMNQVLHVIRDHIHNPYSRRIAELEFRSSQVVERTGIGIGAHGRSTHEL